METKNRTLIFTDIHFGLKNNSTKRLNICINVIRQILKSVKANKIDTVIFGGDLFHCRQTIDVNTLNVAMKCITELSKRCKVYLIIGNHDTYLKNSVDINSLMMFSNNQNIVIVSSPTEIILNNEKFLLCPWLSDLSNYEKEEYDFMVGHFDIPSKFLIKSYIYEHSKQSSVSNDISNLIDKEVEVTPLKQSNTTILDDVDKKSDNLIGSFVEVVKKSGTIFAGHIHKHKEFIYKQRKFIFIGATNHQTKQDIGDDRGYYILDEKNKYQFITFTNLPNYVNIRMSDILTIGFDNFDFSVAKGNIVCKVYDAEVDNILEAKINQRLNDSEIYEELIPDYEVNINYGESSDNQNESIKLIKKSKLDYIRNYIDNISKETLEEKNIDKEKLYKILSEYYTLVDTHK